MRLDAWPRRVASEDADERRAALAERGAVMDLSDSELDKLNAELGNLQAGAARVRFAMSRAHEAMQQWYADLDTAIQDRKAFALWELLPDNIEKAVRHLRLVDDVAAATAQLITDRGLAVAVRRIGGLPIVPPEAIVQAVHALDDDALTDFFNDVEGETAPPWT